MNSNSGIVLTTEGVVIIDTGQNPTDSQEVREAIKKLTPLPVRLVLNTEVHPDHTTGNFVFSPALVVNHDGAFADGHLRTYSTKTGAIIWDYETVRAFQTVNGVKANGGTFNQGGVAVVGGMLFANSGYNHITGIYPGNVLLAFAAE